VNEDELGSRTFGCRDPEIPQLTNATIRWREYQVLFLEEIEQVLHSNHYFPQGAMASFFGPTLAPHGNLMERFE
jgi:hypothetical protein